MPYNLPPPWSSGYAIPDNVEDEGLERRAFITKQMPRGTYDDPRVGNGGFAVPQYIDDEGYGQGTFTTKWQPSGTYSGPKVPNWLNQRPQVIKARPLPGGGRAVTVQPLSGDDDPPLPAAVVNYGAKAAQVILSQVAGLPRGQREIAMRAIMDKVDKSLYGRTQAIFKRYIASGTPPAQALPLAIARAMSAGITAEIVTMGARSVASQAGRPLGLGCYMRSPGAMGDTAPALNCLPPAGYAWVDDGKGGFLTRAKAGATPMPMPCRADGTPWEITQSSGKKCPGGVCEPDVPPGAFTLMGFGFQSPTENSGSAPPLRHRKPDVKVRVLESLTTEQSKAIADALLTDPQIPLSQISNVHEFRPEELAMLARMGISLTTKVNSKFATRLFRPLGPVAYLQDPVNGSNLQLHMLSWPNNPDIEYSPSNPMALWIWLSKVPDPSAWTQLKNMAIKLPMTMIKIVDPLGIGQAISQNVGKVIGTTIIKGAELLGDLACDVVSTPGVGAAAGAVAGVYAGNPAAGAAVGNAGAAAAARSCNPPPPLPPPPPIVATGKSILPLALLAGGGLLAIAVLTKKKKKP